MKAMILLSLLLLYSCSYAWVLTCTVVYGGNCKKVGPYWIVIMTYDWQGKTYDVRDTTDEESKVSFEIKCDPHTYPYVIALDPRGKEWTGHSFGAYDDFYTYDEYGVIYVYRKQGVKAATWGGIKRMYRQ